MSCLTWQLGGGTEKSYEMTPTLPMLYCTWRLSGCTENSYRKKEVNSYSDLIKKNKATSSSRDRKLAKRYLLSFLKFSKLEGLLFTQILNAITVAIGKVPLMNEGRVKRSASSLKEAAFEAFSLFCKDDVIRLEFLAPQEASSSGMSCRSSLPKLSSLTEGGGFNFPDEGFSSASASASATVDNFCPASSSQLPDSSLTEGGGLDFLDFLDFPDERSFSLWYSNFLHQQE